MRNIFSRKKRLNTDNDGEITALYNALEKSHFTVAVTGAGISISAGGVSYSGMGKRGEGGMMSNDPDIMYRSLYNIFMSAGFEHGPTEAHKDLAKLEEMGRLQGIITTNEDCIHTMAGSKNVAEIQGSFQVNTCENCGLRIYGYDIWNHGKMPLCPDCGGRMLPYNVYSHVGLLREDVLKAQEWMKRAELILVIGTSGYFGSAYWRFRRSDAVIIQINPGRTHFDPEASLNIHRDADSVFRELMELYRTKKPESRLH